MNLGKKNETTPSQQAILELKAKADIKKKEGYTSTKPSEKDTIVQAKVNLDKLPSNLCPSKPISDCPKSVLDNPLTYGQRKRNGHCLIIVKGKKTEHIYTRRMEDITPYVKDLPVIKETMSKVKKGSFDLFECTFYNTLYKKEMPRFVQQVISKEDAAEALTRYTELEKDGFFTMWPLDTLFQNFKFVGNQDHSFRASMLKDNEELEVEPIIRRWKTTLQEAEEAGWEGYVLRVPGEKSHISYTMDGKAHRAGGWKYKFVKEGDFVIDEVLKGKSGKHANFYAKFHTFQFDDKGNKIDRGYVGCGILTHDELAQLTKDIDSGARKLPFVVEIEYQSIHDESGKLEFGQIQRIRDDKKPEECITNE